jgi:AAA15 family ATPase/GTPase
MLSFGDEVIFSMLAGKKTEHNEQVIYIQNRPVKKILRSSIIYGINGGWKSNLLKAISVMDYIVSSQQSVYKARNLEPFLLNTNSESTPILLEIVMRIDKINYRYGFEILGKKVYAEWLYETDLWGNEKILFVREGINVDLESNTEWKEFGKHLNENNQDMLFLHVAKTLGSKIASDIFLWFLTMNYVGVDTDGYADLFKRNGWFDKNKEDVLIFLRAVDISIDDFRIWNPPDNNSLQDIDDADKRAVIQARLTPIHITHKIYDSDGESVGSKEFSLNSQESAGMRKLFDIVGPILDTLSTGRTLFIDELDIKLHPLAVKYLMDLFNNPDTNPKKAQLIFTTHNTYLLDKRFLRRDQIWFAQKNRQGSSELYSLAEFEEVRKDSSYSKDYLLGRYGAIPII